MARRFRRRRWWIAVLLAALGAWVAIRIWYDAVWGGPRAMVDQPLPEGVYLVEGVIDAVTIVVSQKLPVDAGGGEGVRAQHVEVRLIGVRLPETDTAGRPAETRAGEARKFTEDFLSGGEARLRFDRYKLDPDDRWRAYVFVRDVMLNEELVRCGLAPAARAPGDAASPARRIKQAEAEARWAHLGRWAEPPGP